jgi:hypothetical protein
MLHISGKVFHESVVGCVNGHETHADSSGIADTSRVPDPDRLADSAPFNRARRIHTTGGARMTTANGRLDEPRIDFLRRAEREHESC